jgi:hypothetical protein
MNTPLEATHYSQEGKDIMFWRKVKAFNMILLEYWDHRNNEWKMKFGLLPWKDLKPIKE